jgi:hypothetical protein
MFVNSASEREKYECYTHNRDGMRTLEGVNAFVRKGIRFF